MSQSVFGESKIDNKTGRRASFIALSSLLHTAVAFGVFLVIENMDSKTPEVVQMELAGEPLSTAPSASPPMAQPQASQQLAAPTRLQKSPNAGAPAPKAAEPKAAEAITEPQIALKPISKATNNDPIPEPEEKLVSSPAIIKTPVSSADTEPEVEALPEEDLVTDEKPTAVESPEMKAEDLEDDFAKVDQEQTAKVAALSKDVETETEQALAHKTAALSEMKQKTAEADAAMAKAAAESRSARLAAMNAAQASVGSNANAAPGIQPGALEGIRSLQDLKQKPGNKKPEYDVEDRFAKRQGEVAFLAYISKEGVPTQLKIMKSSGHRQLDLKSLKAIRSWKFYPGQEGWVEIPITWDLKGGVQEKPTPLRRKVSAN